MSIIFSRQCEYALQAILYMSTQQSGKFTNIVEISDRLEIPMPFLGKTLQLLVQHGLLSSLKGPKGGFKLNKNPDEITLFQIVEAIDGTEFMTACVMGFPYCSGRDPCPMHARWGSLRDDIYNMLTSKTIWQVSREITESKQLRTKLRVG